MGMQERAFQPGPTVTQNLAVTATAASITLNNTSGTRSVRIVNSGSTAIFLAINAVATTTQGMIMLPNTVESYTLPQQATTISAISTTTAGTVYVTIGEGI